MTEEDYDGLVASIYDAAVDPLVWPGLLESLRVAFGGSAAGLLWRDEAAGQTRGLSTRPEARPDYIRNGWDDRNPLRDGNLALPAGEVATDAMLLPRDKLLESDFYNSYLIRYELAHLMALKLWHSGAEDAVMNLRRGPAQDAFGADDLAAARRLMPHLRAAMALSSRLTSTGPAQDGGTLMIEQMSTAAVLLDQSGGVLRMNGAAARIAAQHDGLAVTGNALKAALAEDQARLSSIIGAAARGDARGARRGGAAAVTRPSGRRAFAVVVVPLGTTFNWLLPRRPAAIASLTDPEHDAAPMAECLRALYGLTPSEVALALAMASGRDLKQAAEGLGLTVLSARQYLTRVFQKTGVSRQAELVRLLTSLASVQPAAE